MGAEAQKICDDVRAVLRRWQKPDYIRLHAGEFTAQEMRSLLAVLKVIDLEIRAYTETTS